MTELHFFQNRTGVLLYTLNNKILLQYKIRDRFSRVTVVCDHYESGLTQALLEDNLYYAYFSDTGQLIFSDVKQKEASVILSNADTITYSAPMLLSRESTLYLFFSGYDLEKDNYSFFYTCPRDNKNEIHQIPFTFSQKPDISLAIFSLMEKDKELQKENESLQLQESEQKAMLTKVIAQYNELMDVAKQYRAEAEKWRNKYIYRN